MGQCRYLAAVGGLKLYNTHLARHQFAVQGLLTIVTGCRGTRNGGCHDTDVYIKTFGKRNDSLLTRHKHESDQ